MKDPPTMEKTNTSVIYKRLDRILATYDKRMWPTNDSGETKTKGVFLVTAKNAFVPVKRDHRVNTY